MVTSLDIVDTAVKIGLGALISGVSTYFIARFNHKREQEKARVNRRRELIEGIAEQIEAFTKSSLTYWALTCERAEYERKGWEMPEQRLSLWTTAYLEDVFPELANAEAKLLLIGEEMSQKLVRAYGDFVNEFRIRSCPDGKNLAIESEELTKFRTTLLGKREEVFRQLSIAYNQ
jgi:hypothetical protein